MNKFTHKAAKAIYYDAEKKGGLKLSPAEELYEIMHDDGSRYGSVLNIIRKLKQDLKAKEPEVTFVEPLIFWHRIEIRKPIQREENGGNIEPAPYDQLMAPVYERWEQMRLLLNPHELLRTITEERYKTVHDILRDLRRGKEPPAQPNLTEDERLSRFVDSLRLQYEQLKAFSARGDYRVADVYRVIVEVVGDNPHVDPNTKDLSAAVKIGEFACPLCGSRHQIGLNPAQVMTGIVGMFNINEYCSPSGSFVRAFGLLSTHPEASTFVMKGIASRIVEGVKVMFVNLISD